MTIEAHICGYGRIRKYPAVLCSICKHGIDVLLPDEEIDAYNNKNNNNKVNAKNSNGKTIRSS